MLGAEFTVKLNKRYSLPWLFLICSLMPILLFAACSTSGSGDTTAIPTPTPTPAPALTTYSDQGYTIGYPKGWTYKKASGQSLPTNTYIDSYIKELSHAASQAGQEVPITTFTDSLETNTLTIGTLPNPNATIPPKTALSVATQASQSSVKNYKQVSITTPTMLDKQTWNEAAATGDITHSGATEHVKTVALVTNYPASSTSTKLYFIIYAGPASTFDKIDTTAFQLMLKSFKFS
jgi:hypothetical protein